MNIILIGMRGTGKTTIGRKLAEKLNYRFIETDLLIEDKTGMKIKDFVSKFGWPKFRERETEVLKSLSGNNTVLSTGGGVVVKEENISLIRKFGKIIWLRAGIETMIKRIGNDTNRPFVTGAKSMKEDLENLVKEREELYQKAADYVIDTDNQSAVNLINSIEILI